MMSASIAGKHIHVRKNTSRVFNLSCIEEIEACARGSHVELVSAGVFHQCGKHRFRLVYQQILSLGGCCRRLIYPYLNPNPPRKADHGLLIRFAIGHEFAGRPFHFSLITTLD